MKISKTLLRATVLSLALTAAAHAAEPIKNVVLVHGAYADGSGWRAVYDILVHDGFKVSVVQQPLTGLDDDVQATRRILDLQDGPVVLVGHSYGGMVITDAGTDPKVKALVYVAALLPDVGNSVIQLAQTMAAPSNDVKQTKDAFLYLDPAKFAADFAADLPATQAAFMAQAQMPAALAAFNAPTKVASWRNKPSYAIVAAQDMTLSPDLQRWMYQRAGAHVTEINGSHAVFISQPLAVANVIEAAARGPR
ncbi:MAG: alpha/beta fold hydrolase [Sphingomonadaceae bacterium]